MPSARLTFSELQPRGAVSGFSFFFYSSPSHSLTRVMAVWRVGLWHRRWAISPNQTILDEMQSPLAGRKPWLSSFILRLFQFSGPADASSDKILSTTKRRICVMCASQSAHLITHIPVRRHWKPVGDFEGTATTCVALQGESGASKPGFGQATNILYSALECLLEYCSCYCR